MTDTSRNGAGVASFNSTISSPDRSYASRGAQLTPEIQQMYSIFLWDLNRNEIVADGSLDPSSTRGNAEYFFNVPPKQIDFQEPFSTHVIATQNGGKHIESHGSIFKEIRLTGTTGLRPKKKAPSVVPLLSTDAFNTLLDANFTEVRKIPEEEVTGFDDIHFLRNIFRRYSDFKATGRQVIMVWRNVKDDDYWVVEPKDFKLAQQARSPLTYEYNIQLQGLTKFDKMLTSIARIEDPYERIRNAQRFYSRMQEYQQSLLETFLFISTQISRIKAAGYTVTSLLVGPLTNVIKGLGAITSASVDTAIGLRRAAAEARDNFDEAIEQLKDSFEPLDDAGNIIRRDPVIRRLRRATITFAKILTEKTLLDSVANSAISRQVNTAAAYNNAGNLLQAPSSPARFGRGPTTAGATTTVAEAIVGRGETIRDLALRLLGDGRRWYELAIINDLRAPYTSDTASTDPGVLAAGDRILYPSAGGLDSLAINPVTVNDASSELYGAEMLGSTAANAYGRDIKLTSLTDERGENVTDIEVSQTGDLETIYGIPNVDQAIRLKFITEAKQLPAHPRYGARFAIGSKASVNSFNTFRINTLATLQSDDRIDTIDKLQFKTVGDVLYVDAQVTLKATRDYLSTNFALRRL